MNDLHHEQSISVQLARVHAATVLREAGIEQPMLDARLLLAHVLQISVTGVLLADQDLIRPVDLETYESLIKERSTGVPLAYLTGAREFMGLQFQVGPDVLVPRPDTEPLVEWGLGWLASHPDASVADIGTGSGAIAISVAHHAPENWTGTILATDISDNALATAMRNADRLLPLSRRQRMTFSQGDLTSALQKPVDLLLTNLPYLTPMQMEQNQDLRHEPTLALDGGTDGLDLVRNVISELPRKISRTGAVGFEIDPSQTDAVAEMLRAALPGHQVSIVPDLAGDARHVVAEVFSI